MLGQLLHTKALRHKCSLRQVHKQMSFSFVIVFLWNSICNQINRSCLGQSQQSATLVPKCRHNVTFVSQSPSDLDMAHQQASMSLFQTSKSTNDSPFVVQITFSSRFIDRKLRKDASVRLLLALEPRSNAVFVLSCRSFEQDTEALLLFWYGSHDATKVLVSQRHFFVIRFKSTTLTSPCSFASSKWYCSKLRA